MQVENNDLSCQALWKLEKVTVYIIESVEYVCSLTMRYQSVIQVVGTLHLHTGYDFVIQVIVEGSIETSLIKRPQLQFRKILGSVTCHKIEWITYSIPWPPCYRFIPPRKFPKVYMPLVTFAISEHFLFYLTMYLSTPWCVTQVNIYYNMLMKIKTCCIGLARGVRKRKSS